MEKFKNNLAALSVLAFVVSFGTLVVSAQFGFYGNLMWSFLASIASFSVLFVIANTLDNAHAYVRECRRRSIRRYRRRSRRKSSLSV